MESFIERNLTLSGLRAGKHSSDKSWPVVAWSALVGRATSVVVRRVGWHFDRFGFLQAVILGLLLREYHLVFRWGCATAEISLLGIRMHVFAVLPVERMLRMPH